MRRTQAFYNKYTVNYRKFWDPDGYAYSQTISTCLTREELCMINRRIASRKRKAVRNLLGHDMRWNQVHPFKEGVNYMSISQFTVLRDIWGNLRDRVKTDRNTILRIEITGK